MLFLRAELWRSCYKNLYMFEYVIHLLINIIELWNLIDDLYLEVDDR